MSKKIALVTTTINIPTLLNEYCDNFQSNDYNNIEIIIIGDKKTPIGAFDYCNELNNKYEINIKFWDVVEQKIWLNNFPELEELYPWNSIERRAIGYIMALLNGNDIIISIDDDNYISEPDYLSKISNLGTKNSIKSMGSTSNWFNVCRGLKTIDNRIFYPRGFPYSQKWKDNKIIENSRTSRLVVQAGMWLGDPDIDAVTRLEKPIDVIGVEDWLLDNICLGEDTYCPFNTQNTAVYKDVLPAWFNSPVIDRFSDIWASYLVIRIANHLNDLIGFGHPIVKQNRNDHNLFKDLESELFGMRNTDFFISSINSITLTSNDYLSCFSEIIEGMKVIINKHNFSFADDKKIFSKFILGMELWAKVFDRI